MAAKNGTSVLDQLISVDTFLNIHRNMKCQCFSCVLLQQDVAASKLCFFLNSVFWLPLLQMVINGQSTIVCMKMKCSRADYFLLIFNKTPYVPAVRCIFCCTRYLELVQKLRPAQLFSHKPLSHLMLSYTTQRHTMCPFMFIIQDSCRKTLPGFDTVPELSKAIASAVLVIVA